MVQPVWKTAWQLLKMLNIELPNSFLGNCTPQIENWYSTHVHSSSIQNSQKVETTQIAINREVNKQNVVYPYNVNIM